MVLKSEPEDSEAAEGDTSEIPSPAAPVSAVSRDRNGLNMRQYYQHTIQESGNSWRPNQRHGLSLIDFAVIGVLFVLLCAVVFKHGIRKILKKKWRRLGYFVVLLFGITLFISRFSQGDEAAYIALLVGLLASIHELVQHWALPPVFKVDIIEVPTTTVGGVVQKWYHLFVKNEGFSEAKNVRVKIRDSISHSWVNLKRPFGDLRQDSAITVSILASGEDERFDIGYIGQDNYFHVQTDVVPMNQKLSFGNSEEHTYFLSVIADNATPLSLSLQILNSGYNRMGVANFHVDIVKD